MMSSGWYIFINHQDIKINTFPVENKSNAGLLYSFMELLMPLQLL